jgi:hypothetical protein
MAKGTKMIKNMKLANRLNKEAKILVFLCVVSLIITNIVVLVLANDRYACFIDFLLPFDIAGTAIAFATVYLSLDF